MMKITRRIRRALETMKITRRIRRVLGMMPAGRNLSIFPDDVFLTSYPRSGNTWTRFLIANLINHESPTSFVNIEERVPEIHLFPDSWLVKRPRPRILKSHEYFDPRYPRVIYIVRDPRDVAVSLYHYCIKRGDISERCSVDAFIPRFVAGEFFFAATWGEHVTSWISTRANMGQRFLLLKYEDILEDAVRELEKIANFLQCVTDRSMYIRAAELSSAREMRNLEAKQSGTWKLTRNTRMDKPFVRVAASGSWREALRSESVALIEAAWGPIMKNLGYQSCAENSKGDSGFLGPTG
jgi:hypothetical protein